MWQKNKTKYYNLRSNWLKINQTAREKIWKYLPTSSPGVSRTQVNGPFRITQTGDSGFSKRCPFQSHTHGWLRGVREVARPPGVVEGWCKQGHKPKTGVVLSFGAVVKRDSKKVQYLTAVTVTLPRASSAQLNTLASGQRGHTGG
jgi:hypothetical protein